MGSIRFLLALTVLVCLGTRNGYSQIQEAEQLVLNVEKLSQLKNILSDMKKGYEVVAKGYGTVKNIAQGNFSLHEAFLDGLWLVSPEIRKYYKVAEIISQQNTLVQEYKSAFKLFQRGNLFSPSELEYLSKVYAGVLKESLDHLEQLAMVITAR
ncbi:MAG: TerB family tellurite resistance protein, partial [Pedobacter sp.]